MRSVAQRAVRPVAKTALWRRLGAALAALVMAMAIGACATLQSAGIWTPLAPDGFHDVLFGDSLTDVQMRYPAGEPQTSPLGANSYRLRGVVDRGVIYDPVIYEFTDGGGMQLVIAHFGAASAAAILADLRGDMGPGAIEPSSTPGAPPALTWSLRGGEIVRLEGPPGRLIIMSSGGRTLKQDIDLRERDDFASLDR